MVREIDWHGCYSSNLTGKIHPDAFAHPAKMAWGLAKRIFEHLFERGWLKKGDFVADPFGGIGVTGLVAPSFGCPCILVELEEKWLDLAKQSFELHREQWEKMGKPIPICIQGDSREFSFIIREAVDSIIASPPFQQALKGGGIMKDGYVSPQRPDLPPDWIAECTYAEGQIGSAEGQIGAMKEGDLDEVVALITSPPHADSLNTDRCGIDLSKAKKDYPGRQWHEQRIAQTKKRMDGQSYGQSRGQLGSMPQGDHGAVISGIVTSPAYAESLRPETEEQTRRKQERIAKAKTIHNGRALEKASPGKAALGGGYGISEGQLGAMKEGDFEQVKAVITSPAYGHDTEPHRSKPMEEWRGTEKWGGPHSVVRAQGYGANPDNLGNLPEGNHEAVVNGILTSPPFEKGTGDSERPCKLTQEYADKYNYGTFRKRYGDSNGQIGQEQTATYWLSVAQVYFECWKGLKSGGVIVVVVKDFVRNKKRVPLCDQTLELLKAIGFKPLERIRAWLVKSEYRTTLFTEKEERDLYEAHERERRKTYQARAAIARAEGRRSSSYRPHTFDGWLAAWRQKKTASFFRRDTEKKGSPRIDWEEVLICQKAG